MAYTCELGGGLEEILRFRRDRVSYIGEAANRGIDIRSLRFGTRRLFQINHPDLIQDVLVTHDWNFVKGRGLQASKALLGEGLLTSEGELHRRQRRLVQPSFHSARLAGYADTMVRCALVMRDTWIDGQSCEMHGQMMRLTLDVVGRTLFSADLLADAEGIGRSLSRALEAFNQINGPWAQLFSVIRRRVNARARQERRQLETILEHIIESHRREPDRYEDVLSVLLEAHEGAAGGYMSQELLVDEALTMFLAGHETTANALTWAWYLLANHPAAAARLHAEVDEVLGDRAPTMADLPHLRYTAQVFREVLRLYPPAWIITRQAVTGYTLGEAEVPAGSNILMSPFAMQRDPRFWDNPLEFRPERWAEDSGQRPKFTFFPFGAGTRICIGEQFATMEAVLILATLAQRWNLHLLAGQTVAPLPRITLRPSGGVGFRVEQRIRA